MKRNTSPLFATGAASALFFLLLYSTLDGAASSAVANAELSRKSKCPRCFHKKFTLAGFHQAHQRVFGRKWKQMSSRRRMMPSTSSKISTTERPSSSNSEN